MRALAVFAAAGVGTYLARAMFILALGERRLSPTFEAALRYVGPAVLAALTTSLLVTDGVVAYLSDLPAVAATLVAVVVAIKVKNFLVVLGAGMAVLWTLELLVGL